MPNQLPRSQREVHKGLISIIRGYLPCASMKSVYETTSILICKGDGHLLPVCRNV